MSNINREVNSLRATYRYPILEEPVATVSRALVGADDVPIIDAEALRLGDVEHQASVRSLMGSAYRLTSDVSDDLGATTVTVLSVPIAANQSLRLDYFLRIYAGSGAGQVYLDMAIPSGASKSVFGSITELDADTSFTTHMFQIFPFDGNGLSGFVDAHEYAASITVLVNNGSTAGTVDLKFRASGEISPDVCTLRKGSCVAVF